MAVGEVELDRGGRRAAPPPRFHVPVTTARRVRVRVLAEQRVGRRSGSIRAIPTKMSPSSAAETGS